MGDRNEPMRGDPTRGDIALGDLVCDVGVVNGDCLKPWPGKDGGSEGRDFPVDDCGKSIWLGDAWPRAEMSEIWLTVKVEKFPAA